MTNNNPGGPNQQNINDANELNRIYEEMRNTLRSVAETFKLELNPSVQALDADTQKVVKSIERDLKKELRDSGKLAEKLSATTGDMAKKLNSVEKIESEIEATKSRIQRLADLHNELTSEGIVLTAQEVELLNDATKQMQMQLHILERKLKIAERTKKMISGLGEAMKSLGKIPFIGPFVADLIGAEKVVKRMTEAAAKGFGKTRVVLNGVDEMIKNIGLGLIGGALTAGLKFIIDAVLQFNKQTFEAAKNIGISVNEAGKLQAKFLAISASSRNAGLMTKDLVKSYAEISEQLGFMAPSNREFAETATLIQKRIGASAEQMGALSMQSALSGKSLSKTYQIIQATRFVEGARNKIALTNRQILDGIAKVSNQVTINFKGSVSAISAAVVRATKLGTTLDQVNKQGESLLDFENSISKEFEAQVLTGRELNLTRARDLALNNKTVELMEELNTQGVTYDTFMNQNAIARKAEAEAIGLSVEELSKKLLLQKQANALGAKEGQSLTDRYNQLIKQGKSQEDIAKLIGQQEAADLKRSSIAEKFEAALQRLKDILGSMLMGPVGELLNKFVAFVGNTKRMTELGGFLKKIFDGILNTIERFPQILKAAAAAAKALAVISIVRAVASLVASAAAMPILGVGAGLAVGAAAYMWLSSLMDGGGSGSPPSAGTISASPAAEGSAGMSTPPSAAVAAAKANQTAMNGPRPREGQGEQTLVLINQLDSEVLSKSVVKNTGKLYQKQTK